MNILGIETTTYHDQRPSHPDKPDWLVRAEARAAQAWREYDLAGERIYFDGRMADITQAEYDHMETLWQRACSAAEKLEYYRHCHNNGETPGILAVDWQRKARVAQEA